MRELHIRQSVPFDLDSILKIERENQTAAHWTEDAYRNLWNDPESVRAGFVAEQDGEVVGFVVAREIAGEWELENLAVAVVAQRAGVGSKLVLALLEKLSVAHARSLFLEVRESNLVARKLYEKHGFQLTGRRSDYYHNPEEDALLFQKNFGDLSMKIR